MQQQYKLAMKNKYLNMHSWTISQGKDSFGRTYLLDEKNKIHIFDNCYWNWRKIQDVLVAENATLKYNTDYKRYFENIDFAKINITNFFLFEEHIFGITLETLDFKRKIGATGFEPATSRPPAVRATKLRHTP